MVILVIFQDKIMDAKSSVHTLNHELNCFSSTCMFPLLFIFEEQSLSWFVRRLHQLHMFQSRSYLKLTQLSKSSLRPIFQPLHNGIDGLTAIQTQKIASLSIPYINLSLISNTYNRCNVLCYNHRKTSNRYIVNLHTKAGLVENQTPHISVLQHSFKGHQVFIRGPRLSLQNLVHIQQVRELKQEPMISHVPYFKSLRSAPQNFECSRNSFHT